VRERYRGCLLGLAAGDALGTTLEFSAPGTFVPITGMVGNDAEYGELVPSYGFPGIPDRYGYLLFE